MKKIMAWIASLTMCATALTAPMQSAIPVKAETGDYNYAEALQKSMFFYEVQQSGELPDWNMVTWRDDSMLTDEVQGGWFDAGDHFKFALTNAYTASLLAWGYLEYGDAVKKAGMEQLYKNNLQFGLDYLVNCDLGDSVVYMIGDNFDHQWWGSAEVYMRKYKLMKEADQRPFYTCEDSCINAQMAAALAGGYIIFKDSDAKKAETYLKHAEDLFERADTVRETGVNDEKEHEFYKPTTFYDDLFFAANFLYMATGDPAYLDKCANEYINNLGKEEQSDEMKFTWGHCWDDTMQGAMLLYAKNTGDSKWKEQVKKHLEYWTTGYGGKQVSYTPDGLAWLFQWGSLRHATTTAFLAKVAADSIFADDDTLAKKYNDFADRQMNYAFGDNALKMSYVQGMGENNPKTFHHRTASGIHDDHWQSLGLDESEAEGWQTEYAHTLYGALEGGPDKDGSFTDEVGAYQFSEVAIDYNAGYTACLCAMMDDYGGEMLKNFPEQETPKWNEFEVAAVIQQNQANYTQIQVWAMNHSAWPARVVKDLSYNYYFDVSEILEAGLSIDDITVSIGYDQHASDEGTLTASKPIQYDGNIYYVKLSFNDGRVVMPTGQSEHRAEAQIRIAIPDQINGQSTAGMWNPENDYSFQGLQEGGQDLLKSPEAVTPYITMYDGDTLIYGTEPDGTTPDLNNPGKPTPAPEPSESTEPSSGETGEILWGDANDNGEVDISDVVLMNRVYVGVDEITDKGLTNADVDQSGKIELADSMNVLRLLVHLLDQSDFPIKA
ncbi:MAG: glycoside hydrolase family 9 protein [Oscillospiraceae bacterium]|nr:glycoside hydrolase family 9 protein [Oscillospiraceae bacterium]